VSGLRAAWTSGRGVGECAVGGEADAVARGSTAGSVPVFRWRRSGRHQAGPRTGEAGREMRVGRPFSGTAKALIAVRWAPGLNPDTGV
jgi:hypothetical protein